MGPDYGYGPVNYTNPEGVSPFAAFDNRISYNEMVRHQMVSQYRQNVVKPANMTMAHQALIARDKRFSYGVDQKQDPRLYQRQAENSRVAFGAALSRGMLDVASFGMTEAALSSVGIGTTFKAIGMSGVGGMAIAAGAAMVPMHFVNKGINNALEKRRFKGQISADLDQYRDKLGFSGGLSYDQSSILGSSLQSRMYEPGSFFNKDQQMKIHKIGLANDLLSAKGGGKDSGTMKQYEKNVKELTKTTEDVVKLLQTTTEGAMSVMKELNQKGFGSLKQIKQQVVQAKALGNITGMGSQNMMHVGAAGAQAVQGTPWQASVGAGMYQTGAAQAHMMAQGSPEGAYAVQRAGGVAQAGAALANATMNMMNSGIGTRLAAYAMNGDGSINDKRLNKLLGGGVSAYDIVTQSSQTGYNMGGSRVRFDMFKEDMLNKIGKDPTKLVKMMRTGFESWSGQRPYDKFEDKAWVYAGMYTQNSRDKRLMYESLLGNPGFANMNASKVVESAINNHKSPKNRYGKVGQALKDFGEGFSDFFDDTGESVVSTTSGAIRATGDLFGVLGDSFGRTWSKTKKGIGFKDDDYDYKRANYGSTREAYEDLFSVGKTVSAGDRAALKGMSREKMDKFTIKGSIKGFDAKKFIRDNSVEDINMVKDRLIRSVRADGDVTVDDRLMEILPPEVREQLEGGNKSSRIGIVNAISEEGSKARVIFEKRRNDLAALRKDLSAEDRASLDERSSEAQLKIHAGKHPSGRGAKTDDWYNKALKSAISKGDKKRELAALEGLAYNAYNAKYKADQVGGSIPEGVSMFTDVDSVEKKAKKAAADLLAPKKKMYSTENIHTGARKERWARDTTEAKRLAGLVGITEFKGDWMGETISKIEETYYRGLAGGDQAAADLSDKENFGSMIKSKGFQNVISKRKDVRAVRALRNQRGVMRAGMLYAAKEGGVSTEFQEKAMNLFSDVESWTDFRKNNADNLRKISDMSTEQLMGKDYDTKEKFLGYMNQEKMSGKAAPSYMQKMDTATQELRQLARYEKDGSKKLVVHDGKGDAYEVGKDVSKEEAKIIVDAASKKFEMLFQAKLFNENSSGPSMSASVSPPVLNYFNNRWSL